MRYHITRIVYTHRAVQRELKFRLNAWPYFISGDGEPVFMRPDGCLWNVYAIFELSFFPLGNIFKILVYYWGIECSPTWLGAYMKLGLAINKAHMYCQCYCDTFSPFKWNYFRYLSLNWHLKIYNGSLCEGTDTVPTKFCHAFHAIPSANLAFNIQQAALFFVIRNL